MPVHRFGAPVRAVRRRAGAHLTHDHATARPPGSRGLLVRVSIDTTEPLSGWATTEDGAPVRFLGWMELLRAISALVGQAEHPPSGRSTTA